MIDYAAHLPNDNITKINLGVVLIHVIILSFQNPEKLLEGGDTRVQAHARYRIITLSGNGQLSVCSVKMNKASHLTHESTECIILLIHCCPNCMYFARCMLYSYYSSLVIGMLLCLAGLKE